MFFRRRKRSARIDSALPGLKDTLSVTHPAHRERGWRSGAPFRAEPVAMIDRDVINAAMRRIYRGEK